MDGEWDSEGGNGKSKFRMVIQVTVVTSDPKPKLSSFPLESRAFSLTSHKGW
jgi:hypothetical protein